LCCPPGIFDQFDEAVLLEVIFDTGIWARIGAEEIIDELKSALEDGDYLIVLPPSVLLEVLRTPRADYRDRDVKAMISSGGRRLASEAELCSNEFVNAVRRYRPQWQRKKTDYATVNKFHQFWTEGIWTLAAEDSDEAHRRAGTMLASAPQIVENQRRNRQEILAHNFSGNTSI
jgi:hypothetical protein